MGFEAIFPGDALINAIGKTVTYKRGNDEYPIKAQIRHNVERIGNDGAIMLNAVEAVILKNAISANFAPVRGDKIIDGFTTYNVDAMAEDDNIYQTLILSK